MFYTNGSGVTKTFHGVTFHPGETKEVFGIINHPAFVQSSMRQEPPKRVRRTRSKSDKEVDEPLETQIVDSKQPDETSSSDLDKQENVK